jgi:hypothetical protein
VTTDASKAIAWSDRLNPRGGEIDERHVTTTEARVGDAVEVKGLSGNPAKQGQCAAGQVRRRRSLMVSGTGIWSYQQGVLDVAGDITGYSIHATDGDIGKVDKANNETGSSYLIVATGPWIFGKTVMLPAGVVARVDHENKVVHVRRSKDDIKNAPEYDESTYASEPYRTELGGYYDRFGV